MALFEAKLRIGQGFAWDLRSGGLKTFLRNFSLPCKIRRDKN